MKITEELLNEMKIKDENFSDGLIKPDGDYVRIPGTSSWNDGIASMDRERNLENDPDDDSPLFWLIEKQDAFLRIIIILLA